MFVGYLDWITGYELNFFVFYFIPISAGAWFIGFGAAVSLSVLSAMVWFGVDVASGHTFSSHFYSVWETMVRLISFISIGCTISKIRLLLDR
jgi:hypothetical protein